jgi:hypothetical protein
VCAKRKAAVLAQTSNTPQQPASAGEEHPIHRSDPLVKECMKVFKLAVKENCPDKKFKLKILNARAQEIDGIALHFAGKIKEKGKKPTLHDMTCRFEVSTDRTDAKLLQTQVTKPKWVEGLKASLVMHMKLCEAGKKSDVTDDEAKTLLLMDTYGMGELSLYKGFEHVNDALPVVDKLPAGLLGGASAPTKVDFRAKFSACYPDSGK